nr:MAG TPA: Protein of unknown function (DUF1043) [Caudoviricetes sp.]
MDAMILVTTVVTTLLTVVVTKLCHSTSRKLTDITERFEALEEAQMHQLKTQIVDIFEASRHRGYVTPMELDIANSLADSYFKLHGNHYVRALIARLNDDTLIQGEPIPESKIGDKAC